MAVKKEVKAGIGYTVGNILIKGITFVTLPIFSRMLTTAEFGVFNTYMAYENILAILLGVGMYASIKNAKLDYPDRINEYVSTLLWLILIPFFVCGSLILLFSTRLESILGISSFLLPVLVTHSFGSAMLSISNAKLSLNYSYKKYMGYAGFNTILNIVLSIVLIITVCRNNREVGRIVGAAVPLILIGIYVYITNSIQGKFTFDKKMAKYALTIGVPLLWHYLSQQVQNQFDRIAITAIVGVAFTGIYSFAFNIANILQVIFYSLENVWSVWMFGRMKEGQYKQIRAISKKYMLVITLLAILMLFGSKEVIMLMGDREYWEASTIFIPILLSIYMTYLYTIPVGIEYYYKKTKYIALMTAIAAAVNILLNYLLIPVFGYIAAAYTTLISHAIQFVAHWFISKKILKSEGINSVFCISDILKMLILVVLSAVLVMLLNPYPIAKYCVLFIITCFLGIEYKKDIIQFVVGYMNRK